MSERVRERERECKIHVGCRNNSYVSVHYSEHRGPFPIKEWEYFPYQIGGQVFSKGVPKRKWC